MEGRISRMNKSLAGFCNNLESSSDALRQSLDRRPIPLDSASTTFIQSVNRRASSLTADLNLLESMSSGTVSFEELLGHCHQLYSHNHSHLLHLHHHLLSLGYLPSHDTVDLSEEDFMVQSESDSAAEPESELLTSYKGSIRNGLEDDLLFDESLNLQSLGLSDICLATLASEGDGKSDASETCLQLPPKLHSTDVQHQDIPGILNTVDGEEEDGPELCEASKLVAVLEDDYEHLPSYMKSLAPWEDLRAAVEKMNSFLSKKPNSKQSYFHPEELETMGLGPKGRSYLLLLVRMKRLVVETNNGLISYRVL